MKNLKIVLGLAAVFASMSQLQAAWTEISLEGAQAWASSEANDEQTASKVIDGSGFTAGECCPSGTVDSVSANMWLTKLDDQSNHWWMVKFPTQVNVGALRLWNYNKSSEGYRGFKGTEIYITDDESVTIPTAKVGNSLVMPKANWQLVHPYAFFPQASAKDGYTGAPPTCLGGNHSARYLLIRQIIQHSSGTSKEVGISEIKFYTHTWEASEPADGKLLLSDGFWQIRMAVLDASAKTLQAGAGANWQQWSGNGILSGFGDCDFTDVYDQTGWKVVKLREKIFSNDGSGGLGSYDKMSALFGPDVTETGGSVFSGSSRMTYARLSENLKTLKFSDFTQCGANYNSGYMIYPSVFSAALTEIIGFNNSNSSPGKFVNALDFSKCTLLTTIPAYSFYDTCRAPLTWPKTITTIGENAFLRCSGAVMTFLGPPPASVNANAFSHQNTSDFITIYCNPVRYPAWNEWVTTPLTAEEKAVYPDGIGWTRVGVPESSSTTYHANLLRALPSMGFSIFIR